MTIEIYTRIQSLVSVSTLVFKPSFVHYRQRIVRFPNFVHNFIYFAKKTGKISSKTIRKPKIKIPWVINSLFDKNQTRNIPGSLTFHKFQTSCNCNIDTQFSQSCN